MASVPHSEQHGPSANGHAHSDSHGHDHPSFLHHHFETPVQQFESDKLGMWLFLATEVLFFGGLFCAYSVYRANHPEIFLFAHKHLDWKLGAINTIVLIFSSFTMAWAVRAAQLGQRGLVLALLGITLLCGAAFMGIKAVEYKSKIDHGLLYGNRYTGGHHDDHAGDAAHESTDHGPATAGQATEGAAATGSHSQPGDAAALPVMGEDAHAAEAAAEAAPVPVPAGKVTNASLGLPDSVKLEPSKVALAAAAPGGLAPQGGEADHAEPRNAQTFFSIYFALTGLHGIHVIIGMIVIGIMMAMTAANKFSTDYWTPIDLTGLYWHLVDLIWIFLFPLLYLIG